MEQIISKLTEQYGLFGLGLGIFLTGIAYPIIKLYKKWIENKFRKGDIKLIRALSIIRIEGMLKYSVPKMRIHCPLRKAIFIKLLQTKFRTTLDAMKEVASKEVDKMSSDEFSTYIIVKTEETLAKFEKEVLEAGVPQVALDKFHECNSGNENIVKNVMQTINQSKNIFQSNKEKTLVLFSIVEVVAQTAMVAAEETIDTLNGQLTNINFNGTQCTHDCVDCKFHANTKLKK